MKISQRKIERRISGFEQTLKIRFPQSYRQFLLEQGSAVIAGYKVFGIPTKEVKTSVVEATQALWRLRKDIAQRKLVVISFKKALTDGKEKALCIDTTRIQGDDAPLVEVSDINKEDSPLYPHHSFKEWIEHLKGLEVRDKKFRAAHQRIKNRKNEIRERVIRREVEQRFKNRCPICRKRERGNHLTCHQCFDNWREETKGEVDLVEWLQDKLEAKGVNLPRFTHKGGKEVRRIYIRPQDWHPIEQLKQPAKEGCFFV